MGVDIVIVRAAANTATGTQDFTSSGFGTPKGALFFVSYGVTDGTAAGHAVHSIGATDGTTHAIIGGRSRDAVATSDTDRRGATDEVIMLLNNSAVSVNGEANFDSWITDGVRINWGNAPASAYLVTVILFTGSDLSVDVGNFASNSFGGTNNVDCGFEPDLVFFFCNGTGLTDSPSGSNPCNLGFAANKATITNQSASWVADTGQGTTNVQTWMTNNRCVANLNPTSSTPQVSRSLSVTDFITTPVNGFEITHHTGSSGSALTTGYMALAFGGAVDFDAGTMTTPTSTGDDAQTGPGFTPQFAMLLMSPIGTANSGANDGVIGVGAFTADEEYSIAWADEDNVATTNTQSINDDTAVNCPQEDGTTGWVASHSSMDANGWTLNFSSTLGSAKHWPWLAIESESGAAYTLTAAQGSYTLTGQTAGLEAARTLTAAQGSYALTGQVAALEIARTLMAAQGGYTLSGQDIELLASRLLTASQGNYTLTGQDAALTIGYLLAAAQGSYALTGQDVTLTYAGLTHYTLTAAQGSYTLSGQDAGLLAARVLSGESGAYVLAGHAANLLIERLLTAGQGSYTLTGQDVDLLAARLLAAGQGNYTLTGQAVTLLYSGAEPQIESVIIITSDSGTSVTSRTGTNKITVRDANTTVKI